MIIKRIIGGREFEIELTKEELFNAYCEQEYAWDVESCRNNLDSGIYFGEEWYEDLDEKTEKQIIEEAAYHLRRNIDKYEMSYDYAMDEAFATVLKQYIKEE
jgi:hypothetical protein